MVGTNCGLGSRELLKGVHFYFVMPLDLLGVVGLLEGVLEGGGDLELPVFFLD